VTNGSGSRADRHDLVLASSQKIWHTTAIHLLQSVVDIRVIALWSGKLGWNQKCAAVKYWLSTFKVRVAARFHRAVTAAPLGKPPVGAS
jgi:hypothetical protein